MKPVWYFLAVSLCVPQAIAKTVHLINQEQVYTPSSAARPGVTSYSWSVPLIVQYSRAQGGVGNVLCYTGTAPDGGAHDYGDSPRWSPLPESLRFTSISAILDDGTYINNLRYSTTDISAKKTLGTMTVTMTVDDKFDSGKTNNDLYLTCAAGLNGGSGAAVYYNTVYRFQLPRTTASFSASDLDLGRCQAGSGDVLEKKLPMTVSAEFISGRLKWSSNVDVSSLMFKKGQAAMSQNAWYEYRSEPDDVSVNWQCQSKAGKYSYPIILTWEVE